MLWDLIYSILVVTDVSDEQADSNTTAWRRTHRFSNTSAYIYKIRRRHIYLQAHSSEKLQSDNKSVNCYVKQLCGENEGLQLNVMES